MIVNLLNGLLSLVKYGLTDEFGGFGNDRGVGSGQEDGVLVLGKNNNNLVDGRNRYRPTSGLDGSGVVDELATLLTSGRLSQEKRDLLVSVYNNYQGAEAYINVQQLIVTAPEFNSNGLARSSGVTRKAPEKPTASSGQYRAVVQIMLTGGWDSFNVLVPDVCESSNDAGVKVDEQYRSVRGDLAMAPSDSDLRIDVQGQPCSKFAIHQDVPIIKELYDEGSLVFFANTGVINSAEMTKTNFDVVTVSKLFAHNAMQRENQVVDPFEMRQGTGILGRISEVLTKKGLSTSGISIDTPSAATTPDFSSNAPDSLVVSSFGSTKFNERPAEEEHFPLVNYTAILNAETDLYSSVFGETWSYEYTNGIERASFLNDVLGTSVIGSHWNQATKSSLANKLSMVSRLLQTWNLRGVDRDMFYLNDGFWDHHATLKSSLSGELKGLESGLRAFVTELKDQGLWDHVAILVTSDFGRTLTANGRDGSDHAWGGHYMMIGGGVRGGRVVGEYPKDLTEASPQSIGRGRFMPTTSWDVIWNGICQWMGVETPEEIKQVLPNLDNTHGVVGFTGPFQVTDLFRTT